MFSKNFRYFSKTKELLFYFKTKNIFGHSFGSERHYNSRSNSQNRSGTSYVLLIIPSATFCLGCWQVYRRQWKLNLIDRLQQLINEPPIDLPEDLNQLNDLEYRKVRLRGKFDNSMEMFISPRSLLKTEEHSSGSLISVKPKDSFGVWVITPFEVKDRDIRILVNRGWIPRSKIDPKSRLNGQTNEEIDLIGVIRQTEKRQPFGLKNDINSDIWHYRDVEGLAQKLNTSPIIVDADYDSTIKGGPIGGQTRVSVRNEHLSYIITWYGLSIITFYMWYLKVYKIKPIF